MLLTQLFTNLLLCGLNSGTNYCIAENNGRINIGEFSYLDYLEENGLIMANDIKVGEKCTAKL